MMQLYLMSRGEGYQKENLLSSAKETENGGCNNTRRIKIHAG
jgi:hypothetical protein